MDIKDLIIECHRTATIKGWWSEPRTFGELLMLVVDEAAEAHEEYRNGKGFSEVYYNPDNLHKPEGIPIELADILIRIFDLCGRHGIDLDKALRLKMDYNETRPYRHGGKLA